jgi:expansin (peptidoglycan-binding protein)
MDKCPDDNCGIDLGGAPAAEIMKDQPGRYSGEWEWVSCEGAQGVSDGSPSLHVKAGSGKWWSLVQVRNGPGAVLEIRARKATDGEWQSLPWATEAENFFSVPVEILQDSDEWELEVIWRTGESGFLRIAGEKLGVEESSYGLE